MLAACPAGCNRRMGESTFAPIKGNSDIIRVEDINWQPCESFGSLLRGKFDGSESSHTPRLDLGDDGVHEMNIFASLEQFFSLFYFQQ